jgi:hypothetical protein
MSLSLIHPAAEISEIVGKVKRHSSDDSSIVGQNAFGSRIADHWEIRLCEGIGKAVALEAAKTFQSLNEQQFAELVAKTALIATAGPPNSVRPRATSTAPLITPIGYAAKLRRRILGAAKFRLDERRDFA